jgi:spermidine/putrescine transport system permease protein
MLPTLLGMVALLIVPLLMILAASFGQRDVDGNVIYTFTLDNYARLAGIYTVEPGAGCQSGHWVLGATTCFDPLYAEIAWRSIVLAAQTTALVIVIAYPLAYWVARLPAKRRNQMVFLMLLPLWTNFVIRMYAWIIILRGRGVINSLLGWALGGLSIPFQPLDLYPSDGAVLVGMVYEFLPFMILPLFTSLEKIEPSLYEAAADLGAGAWRTFVRVTLPLSLPGMVAGTILTFVPVMGTFIVSDILGGRTVVLVGNLIQRQFLDARDPAFGSAATILLMALTLVVTLYYTRRFGFGEEIISA